MSTSVTDGLAFCAAAADNLAGALGVDMATLLSSTVVDRIWSHAETKPDAPYVHVVSPAGIETIDWAKLRGRASAYARAFAAAGVTRGSIVLIFLGHGPDLFYSYFGAMALGAAPSFMPLPSPKQDASHYWTSHAVLFDRIKPAAVLTTAAHLAEMKASGDFAGESTFLTVEEVDLDDDAPFVPEISPDDVGLLQHSSGTTGLKKGVALSHRAIAAQLDSYGEAIKLTDDDVIVSWLPVYHDMGLIACTLLPAYHGLPLVSMDPFHWLTKPGMLLDHAETYGGTLIWLPNFAFQHLARVSPPKRLKAKDLSGIRAIMNCSEVCRAATFDAFATTFAPVGIRPEQLQVCYAAAETVFAMSQTTLDAPVRALSVDTASLIDGEVVVVEEGAPGSQRLLSCGTAISALDVQIRAEDGTVLPEDTVGEVTITGDCLFDGYYNLPDITARKLRDGIYYTSDLGFYHAGELYVLGRRDDVIVVNGRNYMAHDLEAVANKIAGLKPGRNVAVGIYNERLGSNEICLVAERDPDAGEIDADAVAAEIREALLDQADAPTADVRVVEPGWLVKTTSGKISREKNAVKYQEEFG
jgi:acyl-CoA synthetase (AMP-forming)/AMP-acid ligase II